MKKKQTRASRSSRSWREIRQSANRKVVTAHARRKIVRGVARATVAIAAMVLVAGAVFFGVGHWHQGIQKVNTALPPQPLREIMFSTDGVLTKSWMEEVLGLPEGADSASIDIHEKKILLEEHGQVKSAVIRRLPDSLVVDLQERIPAVRINTRNEEGRVIELLVDREGHVFHGIGYDSYEISTLPLLAGIALHREGRGFRRLSGIEHVDDLLQIARTDFPWLYRSWKWVDCGEAPLLKVRSEEFREIVFVAGRYTEQLRQLDMIVANNRRQLVGMQQRVDLSLRNQVVVR